MPKRSSKRLGDADRPATFVSAAAVETPELPSSTGRAKDPAAVALGRKGGLKGGKARAASLSKTRRSEIARSAAKARWNEPR
jgi:hypothetical protein